MKLDAIGLMQYQKATLISAAWRGSYKLEQLLVKCFSHLYTQLWKCRPNQQIWSPFSFIYSQYILQTLFKTWYFSKIFAFLDYLSRVHAILSTLTWVCSCPFVRVDTADRHMSSRSKRGPMDKGSHTLMSSKHMHARLGVQPTRTLILICH